MAYYNKKFSKAERNYCTTQRELLAALVACEHFKHYLLGSNFLLRVDHHSLLWLKNFKDPSSKIARWVLRLAEFDYTMQLIADGRLRVVPLHTNTVGLDGLDAAFQGLLSGGGDVKVLVDPRSD